MADDPQLTESRSDPAPLPADSDASSVLSTELRREVARLEAELDRRAQEISDLHALLRRTVPAAADAAPASRRNVGVMLTVLLGAPAVIIVLVVLLALAKR